MDPISSGCQAFSRVWDGPWLDRYDFVAVYSNIIKQIATMVACEKNPTTSRRVRVIRPEIDRCNEAYRGIHRTVVDQRRTSGFPE